MESLVAIRHRGGRPLTVAFGRPIILLALSIRDSNMGADLPRFLGDKES